MGRCGQGGTLVNASVLLTGGGIIGGEIRGMRKKREEERTRVCCGVSMLWREK